MNVVETISEVCNSIGWGYPEKSTLVWIHITPHHLSLEKPCSIFLHKRIFRLVASRLFPFPHLYSSRRSRLCRSLSLLPLFTASLISFANSPFAVRATLRSLVEKCIADARRLNPFRRILTSTCAKIFDPVRIQIRSEFLEYI